MLGYAYKSSAPATTPNAPAAEPASLKFVAIAPEPEDVLEAEPAEVASATWMPKPVLVSTEVVPPVVTVVVTTEVAVVEAVQPDQVVQGAPEDQVPEVQPIHHGQYKCTSMEFGTWRVCSPDHVEAGQPEVPHQLVHGPVVQALLLSLAHGPQPLPAPPNGPWPFIPPPIPP